jgi:hypothetical protein
VSFLLEREPGFDGDAADDGWDEPLPFKVREDLDSLQDLFTWVMGLFLTCF